MNLLTFINKRNLLSLDKELAKMDYNTLIAGLDKLRSEVKENDKHRHEELRALYALIETFTALRKVYENDIDYGKEDE